MNRKTSQPAKQILLALLLCILALPSPASAKWKEKVLYSFQGGADGAYPAGGVVFDKQGNLYGATQQGGGTNCSPMAACGTVYQLVPPAKKGDPWTETVLHVFQGKQDNDGEFPSGGVIADALGNIYGTASYGGTGDCVLLGIKGGCGTVFELSRPQTKGGRWTYATLYSFKGGQDGYLPFGDLVFDSAGNLYGVTYFGGGKGTTCNPYYQYCGTVFELSPPKTKGGKWAEKALYSFKGGSDGANPNGGLVLDDTGAIYGTTYAGGNKNCKYDGSLGCGIAFELKPRDGKGVAWRETVLQRFTADQGNPSVGMIFDGKGYLYGATLGTVFRLGPPSTKSWRWKESILYTFNQDAYGPEGALIFDKNGNLYGTTNVGNGRSLQGSAFRLRPPGKKTRGWSFNLIHGFLGPPDGEFPAASLIFGMDSKLYSTTRGGGTGFSGTVFEVWP